MMNFEGVIGEIDLIQRLVDLGREGFTGAIRFENDSVIKIVYFKGGDVLSASTNDRTDSIDEILLRAGKVTREHVKQALAKRKESETLGDALLGLGFITRKELTWARRVQVIGILRGVLGWPAGSYTIVADYLPKREEGTIFPLHQVLVELVVTDQDRPKFEQAMESGGAVFAKMPGFDDGFRRLGLNEDAEQIAAQIDGQRSAAEVAGASGKDVFNVYKLLEAMRLLGLVEKRGAVAGAAMNFDDFAAVGAADATDAWKLEDDTPPPPALEPPPAETAMPAWDMPATAVTTRSVWDEPDEPALAPPPDQTIELAPPEEPASDHQWGFDEAQIEAARRAAVPVRSKDEVPPAAPRAERPPAPPRRSSALIWILLLVLLGAGGWYGWRWWQGRAAQSVASAAPPPPVKSVALDTAPQPIVAPQPATPTPAPNSTTAEFTDVNKPLPAVQRKTAARPPTPVPARVPAATPRIDRTTTGAPTITNVPAGGGSSDAMQQKYTAMARDFASRPGGAYTVQFELVCETASVGRALRDGGANVWFVTTTYRNRPCYRVFWGRYDTQAAASAAAKNIPSALAGGAPVVVKIPR
jgi:hypothetical protein